MAEFISKFCYFDWNMSSPKEFKTKIFDVKKDEERKMMLLCFKLFFNLFCYIWNKLNKY